MSARQLTCRGFESTPSLEGIVHKWMDRLDRMSGAAQRYDVLIEVPHRSQHQGRQFHVRVVVTMPGQVITANRDPAVSGAHDSVYVAIRDAFRAARRQLDDHAELQRGDVRDRAVSGA